MSLFQPGIHPLIQLPEPLPHRPGAGLLDQEGDDNGDQDGKAEAQRGILVDPGLFRAAGSHVGQLIHRGREADEDKCLEGSMFRSSWLSS